MHPKVKLYEQGILVLLARGDRPLLVEQMEEKLEFYKSKQLTA